MVERSAADSIFVGNPLVRLNCHLLGEDQFAGGAGALSGVMSGPFSDITSFHCGDR